MPSSKKRSDLSAYKRPAETPPVQVLAEVKAEKPARTADRPAKKKRTVVGRPKKPAHAKRDQKITLSLTLKEKQAIVEKAGLIPEATFLLSKLREAGIFD